MSAGQPITFFNRETGRIETEAVYGERALRFVYEHPLGALPLHLIARRIWFSKWHGWRMSQPASRRLIVPFIERYGLDAAEFEQSPGEFASFNDFFSRKLAAGARPVDPRPDVVVFPADGRHLAIPDASECDAFVVKGVKFGLPSLLRDSGLAEKFARGSILISRLCPVDYHRFHFPCDGIPARPRLINGPLFSVSPIALRKRPTVLWENKRFLTVMKTERFGEVLLLEIGATNVGTIVHTSEPDRAVRKGDEKGFFRFGGSCFISIFEPGRLRFADDLIEHSREGREVFARMGEAAAFAARAD